MIKLCAATDDLRELLQKPSLTITLAAFPPNNRPVGRRPSQTARESPDPQNQLQSLSRSPQWCFPSVSRASVRPRTHSTSCYNSTMSLPLPEMVQNVSMVNPMVMCQPSPELQVPHQTCHAKNEQQGSSVLLSALSPVQCSPLVVGRSNNCGRHKSSTVQE